MNLYHVTHKDNARSIGRRGLLTKYSLCAASALYLCSRYKIVWAILHTSWRHGWRINDLIVLQYSVKRSTVRHTSLRGIWRTQVDQYSLMSISPASRLAQGEEHGV